MLGMQVGITYRQDGLKMAKRIPDAELVAYTGQAAVWPRFADGGTWELTRGEDFNNKSARAAQQSVREWAIRNGYRAITRVPDQNTMVLKLIRLDGGPQESKEPSRGR